MPTIRLRRPVSTLSLFAKCLFLSATALSPAARTAFIVNARSGNIQNMRAVILATFNVVGP